MCQSRKLQSQEVLFSYGFALDWQNTVFPHNCEGWNQSPLRLRVLKGFVFKKLLILKALVGQFHQSAWKSPPVPHHTSALSNVGSTQSSILPFKRKNTTFYFSFDRINWLSISCHTKSLFPRTHMRDSQLSKFLLLSPNLTTHANWLISISIQPHFRERKQSGDSFSITYIFQLNTYFIYASMKTSCLTRLCSKTMVNFSIVRFDFLFSNHKPSMDDSLYKYCSN